MTDYPGNTTPTRAATTSPAGSPARVMGARESVRALLNAPSPDNIVFGMNMTTLTFHLSRIISRDWQPAMRSSSPRSITTPTSPAGSKPPQTRGVVHQIPLEGADCALDAAKV